MRDLWTRISLLLALVFGVLAVSAQEAPKASRVIVDIGPNLSSRGMATLKTSQVFGGDGILDSISQSAPKDLQDTLVVVLEKAESNMLLTKFDIAFTIIYGERRFFCEKQVETGFSPGGSYTVNRPRVAFEISVKNCLNDFFRINL